MRLTRRTAGEGTALEDPTRPPLLRVAAFLLRWQFGSACFAAFQADGRRPRLTVTLTDASLAIPLPLPLPLPVW